jgi:cell division cycle protein 20 (cofactor of APC complex)
VYLWDAAAGSITELCTLPDEGDYVCSVAWVEDGSYLAVGTANNQIQLWDVDQNIKVRTMKSAGGRIAAMAWNKHILTTGSRSGEIWNHDVRVANHHIQTLVGHTQEVCGLAWSPDGRFLASGGNDNVVNIWTEAGVLHKKLTDHTAAVKALAWCPWQPSLLATGGGTADRKIHFWNAVTGAKLNTIDTKSQVSSLQWNQEHREIISGHGFSKNQLSIWSYPTMKKVADLTGHTERVLAMAISPDGTTVVSAAGDETLRFWKCFASETSSKKKKKEMVSSSRLSASIR